MNKAKYANSSFTATVRGERVRLHFFVKDDKPTSVELISDGVSMGVATVYSATASKYSPEDVAVVFDDLGTGVHNLEVRMLNKYMYFDRMDVDGSVIESDLTYTERHQQDTGTMGPSAENLEVQEFALEIAENDVSLTTSLSWSGAGDLDFFLVDPNGVEVASSATLENPEVIQYMTDEPGTYQLRVTGYISAVTPFEIDSTIVTAN
ncbi:hypothetical protein [Salinimonas marina]|uniref:hypothetical protein n=1 Tax=Salinimonas marina TaxID=2785918 RepID=UPI001C5501A8|nr:hypothetical protein [Salinimonas marina]